MSPNALSNDRPILDLKPPSPDGTWKLHQNIYDHVQPILNCSSGWIADFWSPDAPEARVSFFRWDATSTHNTLEAFKHLPEQCMGAIGMRLVRIYSPRILQTPGGTLTFDSTQFRPQNGGPSVHIFKCVWVEGFPDSTLRGNALREKDGQELRQLRLAAAITRFRPPHTRVITGGVFSMPSETLAWNQFKNLIEPQIQWNTSTSSKFSSSYR